ncbi:hypothetical protein SAMN05216565_12131 [Litchfieldia salsa]|uniref:Uncharacterized protein n=1 Tax=Litchfieldia salsa TaxID=930152 RepID=A0A1H0X0H7_9BACI|nr:hypothetical protein SAMN05216565_12131 [Litchfieldia salsa]
MIKIFITLTGALIQEGLRHLFVEILIKLKVRIVQEGYGKI